MTEEKSKALNVFAILGFIILLIVGVWSTIQVVKFVPRLFGGDAISFPSISLGKGEIKMNLSAVNVNSEDEVEVSWDYSPKKDGIYSFSYACKEGFHFRLKDSDGEGYSVLPCNAPHNIPNGETSLTIIPVSDSNRFLDVGIALAFTDIDNESVRAVDSITVTNDARAYSPATIATATSTAQTNENLFAHSTEDSLTAEATAEDSDTYTQSASAVAYKGYVQPEPETQTVTRTVKKQVIRYVKVPTGSNYSNPNGIPDLDVRIAQIGVLDPYTRTFIPKGTVRVGERAAAKIIVVNNGDKTTGAWSFIAHLPTAQPYTYTSKAQPSLAPGARAEITLSFDQLRAGNGQIVVTADPGNTLYERNETNNTGTQVFSIVSY